MSAGETAPKEKGNWFKKFDHHMWWIIALSIAGFMTYPMFKQQAFPSASLEIKKSRLEIEQDAKQLAEKVGFHKEGTIDSTVFDYDNDEKTFLEYKYPLEIANKLMSSEVPVWYWHTRMVKEYDQEEFASWISPKGEVISFERTLPNDAKGNSISHEEAKTKALEYLVSKKGEGVRAYKLVNDFSYSKPKREDHSFTWEDQEKEYKGARTRFYLYVSGDEVTECTQYLHVPESFRREYETIRSYNSLLGSCAWLFITLLQVVSTLACIWALVTKNLRWRPAIMGGLLMASVATLAYLNRIPSLISSYSPEKAFSAYVFQLVLVAVPSLLAGAISGAFLFAGSEVFYRKLFPKGIAMEKLFTWKGISQKSVLKGVLVGHFLVGIHFGWIMFYYLVGRKINFWCPLGVEDYKVLSDVAPFFSAIALGVSASFTEELTERIVGIGLGMHIFKNFWIANLFQAVVWGFAHSFYAQQPCYARGLELTVVGLLQGWILRRYGLVACITEHYLLDAFFDVESLFNSDVLALKLSGLLALIPASVIPLAAWLFTRGKPEVAPEELSNEKIPFVKQDPHLEDLATPFQYKPLKNRTRMGLVALAVAALIGALTVHQLGSLKGILSDAHLSIGRNAAIVKAQEVMRKHGQNPDDWMIAADCTNEYADDSHQYMFEKTNLPFMRKLVLDVRQGFYWYVRFFKPMKSEEYKVRLDGQGNEMSFDITREEDDPGASLDEKEAGARAKKYLNDTHHEFKEITEKAVNTQKRKNRTDHAVEFRAPEYKVGEAECAISVSLVGDQVGDYSQWWNVPDSWSFERKKRTIKDEICTHLRTLTFVAGGILFLWWAFKLLKSGAVRWRIPIFMAGAYVLFMIVDELDELPTFLYSYQTTEPFNSFIFNAILNFGQSSLGQCASIALTCALAIGALRLLAPKESLHTVFLYAIGKGKPLPQLSATTGGDIVPADAGNNDTAGGAAPVADRDGPLQMWIDAVLLSYGVIGFLQVQSIVGKALRVFYSPAVVSESLSNVSTLANTAFPFVEVLTGSMEKTLVTFASGIIASGVVAKYAPSRWKLILISTVTVLILQSDERYWQQYLIEVGSSLVLFWAGYFFITRLARTNYLAYLLSLFMMFVLVEFLYLLFGAPALFVPEILALALVLASPLFVLTGIWLKNKFQKRPVS